MASSSESDISHCSSITSAHCIDDSYKSDWEDNDPKASSSISRAALDPEDNYRVWHEMQQTERFLASELYNLSAQERARALDDIHCVGEEVDENPDALERLLNEFEVLVETEQNPIYNIAVEQNRAHVEDRPLRLRFLRCNDYNVARSVAQMMKFLEHKATYFGVEKVAQDITIDDLNVDDLSLLMSGACHVQEERDQSGRAIQYLIMTKAFEKCKVETMIRVAYYVQDVILLPMQEVQMKGVVGVYYDVSKPGKNFVLPGFAVLQPVMDVFTCFPLRYSAVHICLKPRQSNLFLNNARLFNLLNRASVYTRTRTCIHYGNDKEIQYALRSHGVPLDSFLVDMDGTIRKENMNAWLAKHEAEARLYQRMSNQPRPQDVLLGRGYRVQNHEGNARFRNFLMAHRDEYDNATRSQRQDISMRLTLSLLESGIRLFKRASHDDEEEGRWVEVGVQEAKKTVGQLFRTFRKKELNQP